MASSVGTSFWRVAGISYLKYVQLSSKALVSCVKDVAAVAPRSEIHFKERVWKGGVPAERGTEYLDDLTPFKMFVSSSCRRLFSEDRANTQECCSRIVKNFRLSNLDCLQA